MGPDSGSPGQGGGLPRPLPEHEQYPHIWRMLDEGIARDEIARHLGLLPHDAGRRIRYLKAMASIIARGSAKGRTANSKAARAGGGKGFKPADVVIARDAEIWRLARLGWRRERIAQRLDISAATVDNRDRALLAIADLVQGKGQDPAPKLSTARRMEARDDRIRELKEQGWPHTRIAEHLGIPFQTLLNRLRAIRAARSIPPGTDWRGMSTAPAAGDAADPPSPGGARPARWMGRSAAGEGTDSQYLRRRTEREIRIWRMSAEGLTSPRIAECLGVSRNTVCLQLGYLRAMRRVMVEAAAHR